MMNAKKLMVGALAGAMILGTAATVSADFSFNFSSSESSSETFSVEDSKGNTYEVTHTVETVDGETSEFYENVPVEIYNNSGIEMTSFHLVDSNSDNWGANLLVSNGEETTLEDGEHMWGITMNYSPEDTLFDFRIDLADGSYVEYDQISLKDLSDATHMDVELTANGGDSYHLAIR